MSDLEDIETTRGEKLLAAVLAIFVLIGAFWAYDRLDLRDDVSPPQISAADRAAIDRESNAQARLADATQDAANARDELELRRERLNTALAAGTATPALRAAYQAAERRHTAAQAEIAAARRAVAEALPAATAARTREGTAYEKRSDRAALLTFFLRLGFVLAALAAAYAAFIRLRGSRYLPVGSALVAAAALLAFVMGGDYIGDYVEWRDLGPLVLSIVGVALTLVAFVALQRYLQSRIPLRRVRKSECPYCGFPVHGAPHCEGCGREVIAPCPACGAERRVGTAFCGACGRP